MSEETVICWFCNCEMDFDDSTEADGEISCQTCADDIEAESHTHKGDSNG